VVASTRQRVFSTRLGIRVVERGRALRLRRAGGDDATPPSAPSGG
jgi:hypothetical protein